MISDRPPPASWAHTPATPGSPAPTSASVIIADFMTERMYE